MNAIVFDFGGVLFRTSAREMYYEHFELTGRTRKEADHFLTSVFTKAHRRAANKGTMQAVTSTLAAQYPQWADDILAFNAEELFIRNVRNTIEGMPKLVHDAKRQGHKIYGLTNWAADTFEVLAKTYPQIISDFDAIVVSGRFGTTKPEEKIFTLAQEIFSFPDPEKTIFVDDKPENVRQAQATVGWQGHFFQNAIDLREKLGL